MSANFGVLVGLTLTWFSEEMLIYNICIRGFMCSAIKKSWKVSSLHVIYLGQMVQFKGMLIGIYKSPELFHSKHFGLVFSRNFTHFQIKQKIEDREPMVNDVSRSFHVAIVH